MQEKNKRKITIWQEGSQEKWRRKYSILLLKKHPPQHEGKAETNDSPQNKSITSLADVDLGHEGVDHWEAIGEVIHFSLDHLKGLPLGFEVISGIHSNGDLLINHPLWVGQVLTFLQVEVTTGQASQALPTIPTYSK